MNMQKVSAVLGSALFFVVAPCVLAGLIPWSTYAGSLGVLFSALRSRAQLGVLLILIGLPGLVDTFARFAFKDWAHLRPLHQPRT